MNNTDKMTNETEPKSLKRFTTIQVKTETLKCKKNDSEWLYSYGTPCPENCNYGCCRFILGEVMKHPNQKALICIGLNPSTATPMNLDATLSRVQKRAHSQKFDSWYMINLYPQRATDPKDFDEQINQDYFDNNIKEIEYLLKSLTDNNVNVTIWCAWGSNISIKEYLSCCKDKIFDIIFKFKITDIKELYPLDKTQRPHPIHPIASIKCKRDDLENYTKRKN